MAEGSNILYLTTPSTFVVGSRVIVAVGGESGLGFFGTVGVGGYNPAATDTWSGWYYLSKDCPIALVATVTGVANNGQTLTLDKNAAVSTVNANVYFDNLLILRGLLNEAHAPGWVVDLPAGDMAVSDYIELLSQNGWTIKGAGKGATILRTPDGCTKSGIRAYLCNFTTICGMTIIGNWGSNGFGYKWFPQYGGEYGFGVLIERGDDGIIHDISCIDVARKAAWAAYSSRTHIYDCDCTITESMRAYLEWWFGASDSYTVTVTNCTLNHAYAAPGFEGFRSDGIRFIGCTSVNGTFSMNSTGNFLIDNTTMTFKAGAQYLNNDNNFGHTTPAVSINSNIYPPNVSMQLGGTISAFKMTVQGAMNNLGHMQNGIVIDAQNPNITIDGIYMTYPTVTVQPYNIRSDAQNTVVQNFTVTCNSINGQANIDIMNGTITNCTANVKTINGVVQ